MCVILHYGFSSQLMESVDEFIAVLCYHLALSSGRNDGQQIKEILQESLPKMSSKMCIVLIHTYECMHACISV